MNRLLTIVVLAAVTLLLSGRATSAEKPTFTLGFACPGEQTSTTGGEVKTLDVFATLTTTNNTLADGAQGWSLSISVTGAKVTKATLGSIKVNTIYDQDDDNDTSTPPIHLDPYTQTLSSADMFARVAEAGSHKNNPTPTYDDGAISGVIFKTTEKQVMQPRDPATQQILKLTLSATIPTAANTSSDVVLSYVDGYKSKTSQPQTNVITFQTKSVSLTPKVDDLGILAVQSCTFKLKNTNVGPASCTLPADKDYAFFFGPKAATTAFDATGLTQIPISLRNKADSPGFSLGVHKAAGVLTFDGTMGYKNPQDATDIRLIDLMITKIEPNGNPTPVFGDALKGNQPTNAPAQDISSVTRGAALTGFDPGDFFTVDTAPNLGGPGATVGYVAEGNTGMKVIPAVVDPATGDCGKSEILILKFGAAAVKFSRGDANGDSKLNITDAIIVARNIFLSQATFFNCDDMLDVNNDESKSVADVVALLNYMFLRGAVPAAPFKACGTDSDAPASMGCVQPNCT